MAQLSRRRTRANPNGAAALRRAGENGAAPLKTELRNAALAPAGHLLLRGARQDARYLLLARPRFDTSPHSGTEHSNKTASGKPGPVQSNPRKVLDAIVIKSLRIANDVCKARTQWLPQ